MLGDMVCKRGENALENWALLSAAGNKDIFFHLSSFPSGYVILEPGGEKADDATLEAAAQLCKNGTKYHSLSNVKVDYCLCNNVVRGEKPGEAVFKSRRKVKQLRV